MLTDVRTFLKARHTFPGLRSVARLICTLLVAALVIAADTTPSVPTADAHRYLDDVKALTTPAMEGDRKSTRLNSSHRTISYAVFCLKKKKKKKKNKNEKKM